MFSGWYDSPELLKLVEMMHDLKKDSCTGSISTQIALVLDEEAPYYTPMENGAKGYFGDHTSVYNKYVCDTLKTELGRMGAPYHIYEAKDLANPDFDPDKYKLYIFPNMINPAPEVRKAVENRIKGGGRTLLWLYFADVENQSAITDFKTCYNRYDESQNAEFMGKEFLSAPVSCPRFSEGADNGYSVLSFQDSATDCVMYKMGQSYQSYYSLLPSMPAKLLMEICLMAGVHLFSRDEDVIYAGGDLVAIHSEKGGTKHLFFPKSVKSITDAETGEEMKFYDTHLFFNLEKDDTRIFKVKFI